MVLIPNDIGLRMRLQTEASLVSQLSQISGIPSDLPELRPGQRFTANIQEVLPEQSFRALVAGKSLTLSLPEGASVGDTLDLVVVDRSAKTIIAQVLPKTSGGTQVLADQNTTLSPTARLIGSLLAEDVAQTPANAAAHSVTPLSTTPTHARQLAGALAASIENSGLFYESHLARWVTGDLPLAQLLQEPQARHSDFRTLAVALARGEGADSVHGATTPGTSRTNADGELSGAPPEAPAHARADTSPTQGTAPRRTLDPARTNIETSGAAGDGRRGEGITASSDAVTRPGQQVTAMPDDVRALVHQQLDALATSRLVWHGQVWPGQIMDWEIERDGARAGSDDATPDYWSTSLSLTLPALGGIAAKLQLGRDGLRLALHSDRQATAEALRAHLAPLQDALAAAGVPLLAAAVRSDVDAKTAPAHPAASGPP